jgi:hypothetical protein
MMQAIVHLPKPVVAAVRGVATAPAALRMVRTVLHIGVAVNQALRGEATAPRVMRLVLELTIAERRGPRTLGVVRLRWS